MYIYSVSPSLTELDVVEQRKNILTEIIKTTN